MTSRPVWAASKPSRTATATEGQPSTTTSSAPPSLIQCIKLPQLETPSPHKALTRLTFTRTRKLTGPPVTEPDTFIDDAPSASRLSSPAPAAQTSIGAMFCCHRRRQQPPADLADVSRWTVILASLRRRERARHAVRAALSEVTIDEDHPPYHREPLLHHTAVFPTQVYIATSDRAVCYHTRDDCIGLNFAATTVARRRCRQCAFPQY